MSELKRATTTAHVPGHRTIYAGELYAADDKLVRKYPSLFVDADAAPTEVVHRPAVEQATASPGELRHVSTAAAKKAAAKKAAPAAAKKAAPAAAKKAAAKKAAPAPAPEG